MARKIPILIDEGKEQDQAAAIAYSMCRESEGEKDLGAAVLPQWVRESANRLHPKS